MNFDEKFIKTTTFGFLASIIILHAYTHAILALNGQPWFLMKGTFIFEAILLIGISILWFVAEKRQPGTIFAWITYFLFAAFGAFEWIQYNGYFRDIHNVFPVFPVTVVLLYLWAVLVVLSVILLLIIALRTLIAVIKQKKITWFSNRVDQSASTQKQSILLFIIGLLLVSFALPIAQWANQEDRVIKTIEIEDTNFTATFAIWDPPLFSAQVNSTQEIDLDLLSDEDFRTMAALGKMNTTFYTSPGYATEEQLNQTIAMLKMLEAFNCSMVWTIWYPPRDYPPYVRASHATSWINNAREVLEVAVEYNLTNVIGIAADSEQSTPIPYEEYWGNVTLYDDFLTEVQTNESLRHPAPDRETFDTVLVFEPLALRDSFDWDTDMVVGQRKLGLPPHSWTHHHFMTYRQSNDHVTSEFYNYLLLMERQFGLEHASPIVGVTGVQWFAEGYFNGTSERFYSQETGEYTYAEQIYEYDGIDGWEAMKREILFSKAWGFQTVSVFHLNSYPTEEPRIENYGLLDYYGLEALEELAEEWNEPKTISYPIITPRLNLGQRNIFRPNPEVRYDLLVNLEIILVNLGLLALVVFSLVKKRPNLVDS